MADHALITGPITGRIPHGDGFVDVTPDHLYFDTAEEALAVAASIEAEHHARGTHPIQLAVKPEHLDGVHPDEVARRHAAHAELNERMGS